MTANASERKPAGRIFISYRRDGAAGDARSLAHDLADMFGTDRVFMDASMSGGDVWPDRLRAELGDARVVLVLIGPEWLKSTDEWSRRRIDSPADWVRQELELALRSPDKLLIPILLHGAKMPPGEALPPILAGLETRQARSLTHEGWHSQVGALGGDIEGFTGWRRRLVGRALAPGFAAACEKYGRAQLRRVETALLTGGLAVDSGRWESADLASQLVVPDLLPFQYEPPPTERLTTDVAQHVRRAVRDRFRCAADELLAQSDSRRIVIVGGPGSGKTTFLNMMTRMHVLADVDGGLARIPVLLRVRDVSLSDRDSLTLEAVKDTSRWLDLALDRDFFEELFASGRGVLLVDGVDEAPGLSERNELLAKIDLFAERFEDAGIVVSSRTVGYDPRLLGRSFEHFELAPFSKLQTQRFLSGALCQDAARKASLSDSDIERLTTRIWEDSRLSVLAESPLLLSIVARIIVERGTVDRLPRERHALYGIAVEMMLSDWDSRRGVDTGEKPRHLELDEVRQALETVAYRLHSGLVQRGSTSVVDAATIEYEITLALSESGMVDGVRARWQARELLRYAVNRAGLLVESGPGMFAFGHRALQEYLVACSIASGARDASGVDPIITHFDEHGVHTAEWRNINMLLVSMQRGTRARGVIEHVLNAGTAYEEWLHRDLLFVGEVMSESPVLAAGIDDDLSERVVRPILEVCVSDRRELGYFTSQSAERVLRGWRDTSFKTLSARVLRSVSDHSVPIGRWCTEAIVGDPAVARDALIDLIVSEEIATADVAALAVRNLDIELPCTAEQIATVLESIPVRVTQSQESDEDWRLPYTCGELVGLFASAGTHRVEVRSHLLGWLDDLANAECLRGVGATGLGWLGQNSADIRESLVRMLLNREIDSGERSWPAYALHRLGGGEPEVVDAMLTVLAEDAPILCGWAHSYLGKFATRADGVVARLKALAEDGSRATLPWVLAALVRLTGLTPAAFEQLELIALSDGSLARRAGATETLVDCAEMPHDWRRRVADGLVDALAEFLTAAPTDSVIHDVSIGMYTLGSLRVSSVRIWDLCERFLLHESDELRHAATAGIGGLPADADACSKILTLLGGAVAVGRVRGGLVDALHRVLASD